MSGGRKRSEEELDSREWSKGEDITLWDARKMELAIERFWAIRGKRSRGSFDNMEGEEERVKLWRRERISWGFLRDEF